MTRAQFLAIWKHGFEAGWARSAEGFNAEYHPMPDLQLKTMRDEAALDAITDYTKDHVFEEDT